MLRITFVSEWTLTQLFLLFVAFLLSAAIGVERQRRLKSAGIRTHTLVGLGSALFTLVSGFGFSQVLGADVVLDPSRIAAQIVSGVGFLGAGVIFVRQNAVSGLTTAASVWVTAAIGMACGAGMPVVALATTGLYVLAVTALSWIGRRVAVDRDDVVVLQYKEHRGALRAVLERSTELGFDAALTRTRVIEIPGKAPRVEAGMKFRRPQRGPIDGLLEALSEVRGVVSVQLAKDDD